MLDQVFYFVPDDSIVVAGICTQHWDDDKCFVVLKDVAVALQEREKFRKEVIYLYYKSPVILVLVKLEIYPFEDNIDDLNQFIGIFFDHESYSVECDCILLLVTLKEMAHRV